MQEHLRKIYIISCGFFVVNFMGIKVLFLCFMLFYTSIVQLCLYHRHPFVPLRVQWVKSQRLVITSSSHWAITHSRHSDAPIRGPPSLGQTNTLPCWSSIKSTGIPLNVLRDVSDTILSWVEATLEITINIFVHSGDNELTHNEEHTQRTYLTKDLPLGDDWNSRWIYLIYIFLQPLTGLAARVLVRYYYGVLLSWNNHDRTCPRCWW